MSESGTMLDASRADGTLSLYFQLKDGEKADLEVIALAALKWAAALRAAAREIDPEAEIKIELVDASEGSLRLNTILDWFESQLAKIDEGAGRHWRLKKLAIALAIFIPITGVPTYDFYFGSHDKIELSEQDRNRIDELIRLTKGKPEVEEKKREFFKALEKDPSIKGVGITERADAIPQTIIPSSEFAERSGLWARHEEDDAERTIYPILDVTLISPVLVKKPRSWRFQPAGLPEFSAKMQDEQFLSALEEDHLREHLRIGIPMRIRLKVEERNEGGVWIAKQRSVIEVISPTVT